MSAIGLAAVDGVGVLARAAGTGGGVVATKSCRRRRWRCCALFPKTCADVPFRAGGGVTAVRCGTLGDVCGSLVVALVDDDVAGTASGM